MELLLGLIELLINNKYMIKEITQSVIAVLVVGGAIYAAIVGNTLAVNYLVGIAGIVIGFYFQDGMTALKKAFGSKKK